MKKSLFTVTAVGSVLLLWLAVRFITSDRPFATPSECVQQYFQALKKTNGPAYLDCLAPDHRYTIESQNRTPEALSDYLRTQGNDLHNVTLVDDPHIDGDLATVLVDQTFSGGQKRQKILLVKIGSSWYISGSEQAQTIPTDVPHGTHIGKVP